MCIIKALSSGTQPPPGSSQLFSDSRKELWELFSSNISCLLGISCDYMLSLVRYLSILANTYNKGETSQRDVDGKEDERIWTSSTPEHSYRITVSLCLGYGDIITTSWDNETCLQPIGTWALTWVFHCSVSLTDIPKSNILSPLPIHSHS